MENKISEEELLKIPMKGHGNFEGYLKILPDKWRSRAIKAAYEN